MSYTGRDLVSASLRLIGALASGESLPANEATDGLASLNDLLDSWSTESLLIPNKVREVFPLTSGQASYTMGSSGNFNTSRPQKIENAAIQQGSGQSTTELPIKILTKDQYAHIILKQAQSTFPTYLYADNSYPQANLNFWPVPSQANNVVFYSWKPLSQMTLASTLSLPPGYQRALKYNLAIELAPEYGRAIPESVGIIAAESKAAIKRMNTQPKYLEADSALRGNRAVWNWMTGEPT